MELEEFYKQVEEIVLFPWKVDNLNNDKESMYMGVPVKLYWNIWFLTKHLNSKKTTQDIWK